MRLDYLKKFVINKKLTLANYLTLTIPNKINYLILKKNSINLFCQPSDINFLAKFLSSNSLLKFKSLIDIVAVDFPQNKRRFKLIYLLLSNTYNVRLNLKTFVSETEMVSSLKKVFKSSNWLEREVWDLYGVYFINNTDLRRILTDYGFKGYPFRKDFPLTGYLELRHDDSKGDIVYEPVELSQELRFFNFSTGWEQDQ